MTAVDWVDGLDRGAKSCGVDGGHRRGRRQADRYEHRRGDKEQGKLAH